MGPDCYDVTLPERVAIGLLVQDSISGASPAGVTAVIQAADGRTIRAHGTDSGRGVWFTFGGGVTPDVYLLLVDAQGYRRWERMNIRVPADECGRVSRAVELTARLQPIK